MAVRLVRRFATSACLLCVGALGLQLSLKKSVIGHVVAACPVLELLAVHVGRVIQSSLGKRPDEPPGFGHVKKTAGVSAAVCLFRILLLSPQRSSRCFVKEELSTVSNSYYYNRMYEAVVEKERRTQIHHLSVHPSLMLCFTLSSACTGSTSFLSNPYLCEQYSLPYVVAAMRHGGAVLKMCATSGALVISCERLVVANSSALSYKSTS